MVLGELNVEITGNSARLRSDLQNVRSLGTNAMNGINTAANNMASNMNSIGSRISKSFTAVGGTINKLGTSMQSVGRSLTKNVTVPLAAIGVASFKLGKDFEKSMSEIHGLVGISKKQVNSWSKSILKLGPELGKSPKELADAMYFVTSAGMRGAQALDVLKLSAKASAAGLGETKTIADLTTSAINAYGKQNISGAEATDILIAAVREGKADAAEFAASLGEVLPIASEMGVTFDQVAATQAAMTKTGTGAAEAATHLKAIMAGLIKPSKQAEEQLNKMGTSSAEMRKKIKKEGLLNALLDLRKLTNKYGEDAMAKVFPNIRALTGVLDLLGKNSKDNVKIMDEVTNSTGSLDQAFKAASETVDFKWNQAISQLQANAIGFFDQVKKVMVPVLEVLIKVLSFVSDKFNKLSPTIKNVITGFAIAAAAVGPLLTAIGGVIGVIGLGIAAFGEIAGVIAAIGAPIAIAIGAVLAIIPVLAGLLLSSESLRNGLKNKFQDISKKIKEVAGWIKTHIGDIKKAFSGLFEGLQTGNFDSLRGALVDLIPANMITKVMGIVTAFENFRNKAVEVRDKIISFGSTLVSNLEPLKQMLLDMFARFDGTAIIEAFNGMKTAIEPLLPILGGVAAIIVGVLIGAINGIVSAFDNVIAIVMSLVGIIASVLGVIVGLITLNTDLIQTSFNNLWTNLINLVANFAVGILDLVSGFIDGIVGFFQYLYNVLVGHSIVPDLINAIINFFKSLVSRIKGVVKTFVSSVINFFKSLKNKAIQIFNNLKTNVSNIWNNIKSKAIQIFNNLKARISNIWNSIKSKAVNVWNNIKSRITSLISNLISSVRAKFNSMKSTISSIFNAIKSLAVNAWRRLKSSVISVVSNLISSVKSKFSSMKSQVSSILNRIGNISLRSAGAKIMKSLINGISSMIGKVKSTVSGVASKIKSYFPFSPAKQGPLKKLNKINFASSINASLKKAISKVKKPSANLAASLMNNIESSGLDLGNLGNNIGEGKTIAFNGPMYFQGVNDTYDFMKKMTAIAKRYTGRRM